MEESDEFNVAYDKCDGTDNPERCIESSYLSWRDAMRSGTDDGTTNHRPVGQFVTNQAKRNNHRKKNKKKKTLGGLTDEQIIAAGTGVKANKKRDRQKRKNRNNNNKKKKYWGDRRWKKQDMMPADHITPKIDDLTETKLDDPVPEECRLARQIYDDAVAELILCDEVLIKKSNEMETSPMCTEGSGEFDAPACLGVLKQVRQDVDQVKRGVANERDKAKKRIDESCNQDAHDFSAMPGRPNDVGDSNMRARSPDQLPAPSSEAIVDKDGATPQGPSDHQVHVHVFLGDSSTNDEAKATLPMSIQDRTNIDSSPEARSSSLEKTPSQEASSATSILDEHVLPTDRSPNQHNALLVDVDGCKSATKVLKEYRDKLHELENDLQNEGDDEVVYQHIQRQIGRVEKILDETKAEKLLYCSHGKKI